jgi:hypothetical protein
MKTLMKTYALPAGLTSHTQSLFTGGVLPKTVIVFQVDSRGFDGTYKNNPFYFQHFNLNRIALRINGRSVPSDSLTPDFTKKLFSREYQHMFMNTGSYRLDRGNCISIKQFEDGLTIFPFDLTPDHCNGYHLHKGTSGNVDLELSWSQALAKPVMLMVYAAFDQAIILTESGGIFSAIDI